jgi:hypothetical protein
MFLSIVIVIYLQVQLLENIGKKIQFPMIWPPVYKSMFDYQGVFLLFSQMKFNKIASNDLFIDTKLINNRKN